MKTTGSTPEKIGIPANEPGPELEIERIDSRDGLTCLAWLLACPEKGFFVPIESESTDALVWPSAPTLFALPCASMKTPEG
jgi:hypothetical protein